MLAHNEIVIDDTLLTSDAQCQAEEEKFRKALADTETQLNEVIAITERA